MANKITLNSLADLNNSNTAINTINTNFTIIPTAMNNTLSLDGTDPNQMASNLDMNSNRILNLPSAVGLTEPVRLNEFNNTVSALGSLPAATIACTNAATAAAASATASAASATAAAASATNASQTACGTQSQLTANHTVLNSEKGFIFLMGGNSLYTLTLGDPTTYDTNFYCTAINTDVYTGSGSGRAKRITLNTANLPNGFLWPGQWVRIMRNGTTWVTDPLRQRWKTSAGPTWYIDPTGSDTVNDGLATGASGAFQTLNGALSIAKPNVDYSGVGPTFQLAPGTYAPMSQEAYVWTGGNALTIRGAQSGDPTAWTISVPPGQSGMNFREPQTVVILQGIRFTSSGAGAIGVQISQGPVLDIDSCMFSDFTSGTCISANQHSNVNIDSPFINGNSAQFLGLGDQSYAVFTGNWTISAGISVANFVNVVNQSTLQATGLQLGTISGTTGRRYQCLYDSTINLGAGVADTLPGNVAGVTGGSPLHGTDSSMVF